MRPLPRFAHLASAAVAENAFPSGYVVGPLLRVGAPASVVLRAGKRQGQARALAGATGKEGAVEPVPASASASESAGAAAGPTTTPPRQYFLLKSNAAAYSIFDLAFDREIDWDSVRKYDGVRDAKARSVLRTMNVGDRAFFYHVGRDMGPGIAGTMKVVRAATAAASPAPRDKKTMSPEEDQESGISGKIIPKKAEDDGSSAQRCSLRVRFERAFPALLTMKEIKAEAAKHPDGAVAGMDAMRKIKQNVFRVTEEQWKALEGMVEAKLPGGVQGVPLTASEKRFWEKGR